MEIDGLSLPGFINNTTSTCCTKPGFAIERLTAITAGIPDFLQFFVYWLPAVRAKVSVGWNLSAAIWTVILQLGYFIEEFGDPTGMSEH